MKRLFTFSLVKHLPKLICSALYQATIPLTFLVTDIQFKSLLPAFVYFSPYSYNLL